MDQSEFEQIHARWPDHLGTYRPGSQQLLALLSLNAHDKVIDKLLQSGQVQLAAIYSECCLDSDQLMSQSTLAQATSAFEQYALCLKQVDFVHLMSEYESKASVTRRLSEIEDEIVRSAHKARDWLWSFQGERSQVSSTSSNQTKHYLIQEIPIKGL
jgi:hypothetical protein